MRTPAFMFAILLAAGAVQAQSVPQASDSWSTPAPASTASYRSGGVAPAAQREPSSHFKFKERRNPMELPGNTAQERSGRAAVGGTGSVDGNGRPAVSCPQTPMDPACH
ncbi:MAG TPA: hypothetical protein VGU03_02570 [Frateuria sp.]|uniref:hypothetical protein n=1 Tax=Frateuria sp. TaxID=2211372 RepID=UPI002DF0C973|nr:hypothetical protein [Frateuria sp.]